MALLKMAYTGFKRYRKRRKNLTIILIGSFFLISFFISLFTTINQNLRVFWVNDFVGGDLIVTGNLKNYDFLHPLPCDRFFSYRQFLKENPKKQTIVFPRVRIGALLESKVNGNSISCIVNGVDIHNKSALTRQIDIIEGRILENQNEIVLPEEVAANLNAKIGDQIVIYVITKDGYNNFDLVKVVGFVNIPLVAQTLNSLGQAMVYMPIGKVRELITIGDDIVSELVVPKAGVFQKNLQGDFRGINGLTSFSFVRSFFLAFWFLETIILLLVFVLSLSSIYYNVGLLNAEREKEIGIYLTFGGQPFWIRRLMLYELAIYTLYCSILGGIFTFLAISGLNGLGIYPIDEPTQILMACSQFIVNMHIETFIISFLIMIVLVFIGSLLPIWRSTGSIRLTRLFE